MRSLDDYRGIVGEEVIGRIFQKASPLVNKHFLHINSTYQGGGVAEILHAAVALMNDAGVDMGWRILFGTPDFFTITKKFHNALQGERINFTSIKKQLYLENNERFAQFSHIDHDGVIIHDPQPLPLIKFERKRQPWIWRCHVDLSHPDPKVWDYLMSFVLRYDMVIISDEKYKRPGLPIEQRIITPSIDPLSLKNIDLTQKDIAKYTSKFSIPLDKPIITQISRFDKWKDPEGVLKVFLRVKEKIDCRLVLCGNMASDDPEGVIIYEKIHKKAQKYIDKGDVILITVDNQILVNVLQRISSVILQKSLKEGFGLTVTESLWKETPVVASDVGGIPRQVIDGENGFLVNPRDIEGCAEKVIALLEDPALAKEMGARGKEHVRKHFLITRSLLDYFDLLQEITS